MRRALRRPAALAIAAALAACAVATLHAQGQMPDPKAMSGLVLPVPDLPAGTVTVRVIRGNFDQNVAGQDVEFDIDGRRRQVRTSADGRAEVTGLARGAKVRVVATVAGERLESQEAVVGDSGLRIILVATDPEAAKRAEEDARLAASAAVKGVVVLGPESRIIAEMSNDRLNVYYILEVINSARTPVDIGGPIIFDLPREARGATILDGSSQQATANGPRITVVGPFSPGKTAVEAAFELPYSGPVARLHQVWPLALPQLTVMVPQIGGLTISSPQFTMAQEDEQQGQRVIFGIGPAIAAGEALTMEIAGLPYRSQWPRYIALALAGIFVSAGLLAAIMAPRRRTV